MLHGLWDVRLGGDATIAVTDGLGARQLLAGDDPVALVRAAARQSRLTKERAEDLMVIIRQAAGTEPALAELWEKIETEFRAALGGFAERLASLGALAVDGVRLTDLLTLNHPDTWYLLVRRCGWTADQYEQWVGDTSAPARAKSPWDHTRRARSVILVFSSGGVVAVIVSSRKLTTHIEQ